MKIFFLLLLFCPVICVAQIRFSHDDSSIRKRFVKDLAVLTSDSLEGRYSGSDGEKKAYEYIIRQFSEAGLAPLGSESGSWLQPFPRLTARHYGPKNLLTVNGKKFLFRYDFGAVNFSSSGACKGEVVDVARAEDPGITGDDQIYKDKIPLIDLSVQQDKTKKAVTRTELPLKKLVEMLASHGAAGVILWNSDSGFPDSLFDFSRRDTVKIPVIYANSQVLREIVSHHGSEADISVMVRIFRDTYHNVVGYIDNHAAKTVIFGAHYDHMGFNHKDLIRYGADDNASGTTMVMELARYFCGQKRAPVNYLFIAFSGEEEGLLGSSWFVKHPTTDLSKVSFMVNFDMVGRLGCEGNRITILGTGTSPAWKAIYKEMGDHGFRVSMMKGAPPFSDHYPFYSKKLPVSYFTTGLHYDYHTPTDVSSLINYDGMVSISRYAEEFTGKACSREVIPYEPISDWHQFIATASFVLKQIDYILVVGPGALQ